MSDAIEVFPLCWPVGRARTRYPTRSNFETTFAVARDELVAEVKRLGGRKLVLSTNIPLRQDGLPYASYRRVDDFGVAAYFEYDGKQVCFACDRWDRIEDNMRAIVKTIDALRGIARWGTGDMLKAAFTGFTALPAPGAKKAWHEVLGVAAHAPTGVVENAARVARSTSHPDRPGGSHDRMVEVNRAWDEFKVERGLA